ncbi:hypothetical protein SteCoe_17460 [Stentor coeruleus]|uniref:Translin-associated factor X-interacting protein 1 N-terminal domain-containing protein n=1 Tax=Stentor coeruleus TaxID=5963 RepID=A0A1R2BYU7_9CILI|nr:hypothetical protein SteCoe_17460 [Stentor coeruleus]
MRLSLIQQNRKKASIFYKDDANASASFSNLSKSTIHNKSLPKNCDFSFSPYALKKSTSKKVLKNLQLTQKLLTKKSAGELFDIEKTLFGIPKKPLILSSNFQTEDTSQVLDKEITQIKSASLMRKLEQSNDKDNKIQVLAEIILEIAEDNTEYGEVLRSVVKEYENTIENLRFILKEKEHDIKVLENGKVFLSSELGKHISQNKKVSEEYQMLFNKYIKMCSNMLKTSRYDIGNIERTEENWHKIISQNIKLENTLGVIEDELDYYKSERKRMKEFVNLLENGGGSVENVFFKNPANLKLPVGGEDYEEVLDNTDNEDLISVKMVRNKRDSRIPELRLDNIIKIY